jgi:dGTPase
VRLWKNGADESQADTNGRHAFGADNDRILYSSAYRRLNGVTQVVSANETELFHNRLTHSYKVAQVGARITNTVIHLMETNPSIASEVNAHGGLDPRVVRAACYGHDLGHPPFGHVAEKELDKILWPPQGGREESGIDSAFRLPDGFEGNAQSFRIVTKLAFREKHAAALDLTRATLRALLKYPWLRNEDLGPLDDLLVEKRLEKWGAYDSELPILEFARGEGLDRREVNFHGRMGSEFRTIEAQIMDWADDITYAIHDIEDFFRAGLIPLDKLNRRQLPDHFQEFFLDAWDSIKKQVGEPPTGLASDHAITFGNARMWIDNFRTVNFPVEPYSGRRFDREGLHDFASELIEAATEKVTITEGGLLFPSAQQFTLIETLKKLTRYYVIQRPGVSSAQRGQALLIRRLFEGLLEWVLDAGVIAKLRTSTKSLSSESDENAYAEGLTDRAASKLQQLPRRLIDYLVVAFHPDPRIGCTSYLDATGRWVPYTAEQRLSRAIVDYIVSLTESQAVALDARLSGFPAESMLEKWVSV